MHSPVPPASCKQLRLHSHHRPTRMSPTPSANTWVRAASDTVLRTGAENNPRPFPKSKDQTRSSGAPAKAHQELTPRNAPTPVTPNNEEATAKPRMPTEPQTSQPVAGASRESEPLQRPKPQFPIPNLPQAESHQVIKHKSETSVFNTRPSTSSQSPDPQPIAED